MINEQTLQLGTQRSCIRELFEYGKTRAAVVGAAERETLLQEHDTYQNASNKAKQSSNCSQVTAAKTNHHTQRAAQEDQCADHDECTKDETACGGRTGLGLVFFKCEGRAECTEHHADDFGTDVLNDSCTMQTEGTGNVTFETGNAETHVFGVTHSSQNQCGNADCDTGDQDRQVCAGF